MTGAQQQLAELVRRAFGGVTLGNGIGLREGQGLDDYADAATLARNRSRDEKTDWSRIPPSELNECYSSLSFFDAEGMRFHLPAFLLAQLDGTYTQDVVFDLTYLEPGGMSRFDMLNSEQRQAVREFLLLRLSDRRCEFERPRIERALAEYWTRPETTVS